MAKGDKAFGFAIGCLVSALIIIGGICTYVGINYVDDRNDMCVALGYDEFNLAGYCYTHTETKTVLGTVTIDEKLKLNQEVENNGRKTIQ